MPSFDRARYLADLLPNATHPQGPDRENLDLAGIARFGGSTFVIWRSAEPVDPWAPDAGRGPGGRA